MAMRMVVFVLMMVGVWGACNGGCLDVEKLKTCQSAVALSNPTDPTDACCRIVKNLKADEIKCLCDYKANEPYLLKALGVDPDRCTQLPAMCNLSTTINC